MTRGEYNSAQLDDSKLMEEISIHLAKYCADTLILFDDHPTKFKLAQGSSFEEFWSAIYGCKYPFAHKALR